MNEQQMRAAMMATAVNMTCRRLTDDQLCELNMDVLLGRDPRHLPYYNKVAHLFTECDGTQMHKVTKNALAAVVNKRLQ